MGGLLGHVVAGVDAVAGDVVCPGSPDGQRIAVEVLQVIAQGPQHEQRLLHTSARITVLAFMDSVDRQTGSVVLETTK